MRFKLLKRRKHFTSEDIIILIVFMPVILIILFFIGVYYLIKSIIKKEENLLVKNIADMSPYEFEHYIAKLFEKMGYKTRTTHASADFGVDVIAKKENETIAIQVKKYDNHPIGNREVQMLLGAMQMKKIKANKSIIITTSRFTKNAFEQAEGCPIELWDGEKLSRVIKKYY